MNSGQRGLVSNAIKALKANEVDEVCLTISDEPEDITISTQQAIRMLENTSKDQ